MKIQGIDHLAILVKDHDQAVDFFSRLFELEFEELPYTAQTGMRLSLSRPNGMIEFMTVVDPVKALCASPSFRVKAELAASGYEGVVAIVLKVEDAAGAAAEAESEGVRILQSTAAKAGIPFSFLPAFKEVLLDGRDTPVKGLGLIEWLDRR